MITIEQIQKTIEKEINPTIALHSGSCTAISFIDGLLTVDLQGGCVGCPSSKITLFTGILPILQEKHPEIVDIELI